MTWTRLGDTFTRSPAILSVSIGARWLHVEALTWCNQQLTDGAVPSGALRAVTTSEHAEVEVAELVAAGLWAVTPTGWAVDWSEQEPAERVAGRMKRHASNQAAFRDRVARCRIGDHAVCGDSKYCPLNSPASRTRARVGEPVTGHVSDDVSDHQSGQQSGSQSNPIQPDPKGGVGIGGGTKGTRPERPGANAPAVQSRARRPAGVKFDANGLALPRDVPVPKTEDLKRKSARDLDGGTPA